MFYVYLSYETQKEFNRFYIGYRKCPEHLTPATDPYLGSYTDKTFEPTNKIVIQVFLSGEEAIKYERHLQEKYNVVYNNAFANKTIFYGDFFYVQSHSIESKEKISKTKKSQNLKGEKSPMWGKTIPAETRDKIRKTLTGRKLSDECKSKISLKLKGRKLSESQVELLRKFKHTDECKQRLSLAKMGDKNPMKCTKYTFRNIVDGTLEENVCIKDMVKSYPNLKTSGVRGIVKKIRDKYKNWELVISSQDLLNED